jgi:pimeloyl-ACP methyl ester carboxylesterase
MDLVPKTFQCLDRTHYFQIPHTPNTPNTPVKGTVVFLAGCYRKAQGFWPASPSAPNCLGFPEDVSHTQQVLAKKYAILVPTPVNQHLLGFTFTAGDHTALVNIIVTFLRAQGLTNSPVILAGASAGAGMALRLPRLLKGLHVQGIIAEVSTSQDVPDDDPSFPPVAYVVMERDVDSVREARARVASLTKGRSRGGVVISPIRKIGPTYFADRIPGVSRPLSFQVTKILTDLQVLGGDGFLQSDPKRNENDWQTRFRNLLAITIQKVSDVSDVSNAFSTFDIKTSPSMQALLVAWAQHEHVADYTTAALNWIEAGGNFPDLALKQAVSKPTTQR